LNKYVIDMFNKLITADLPLIGPLKDVGALRDLGLTEIPKLAMGGVVTPQPGGREVIVGEAGAPEAVIPLTPKGVRSFIEPIIADLNVEVPTPQMLGLLEAVGILGDIRNILRNPLRVEGDDSGANGATPGSNEWANLERTVGLSGVVG